MTSGIDTRDIRAMLQQRLPELMAKLFPQYGWQTPVMTPRNPTRDDRRPGSFVIWTSGAAAGGFNEYSPKGPPARGDVVDLIAYVHNRAGDRRFAFAFARDFLGLRAMDPAELANAKRQARQHTVAQVTAQSEAITKRRIDANKLWRKTLPIAGSVAETYLASRWIALQLIQNREDDLRFLPRLEHWKSAQWDRSTTPWTKIADGPHCPVMVAAARNLAGEITAVHCTFLRADGFGKADVSEPKLMRGDMRGSAIRLTRGDGNMPLEEARSQGVLHTLMPFEGIENALSYAAEVSEARIWACGSFDLMLALPVESEPLFDPVIYGVDNDDNPKAEEKLRDRLDELQAVGRQAALARPPRGVKDFNDLIRGD